MVATCCVADTEFLRFGDEKSRRLFLIIRSTIMLTILVLFLAMVEANEKQAGFPNSGVITDHVEMDRCQVLHFFSHLVKGRLTFIFRNRTFYETGTQ